ncbi:IS5 family transposase [Noviherbaspirillum sp. DKR-6]|uniref:IS5 family transposase n=1 Tax=Noviherbaspirillum pedocola TaxID=2801341 RepID=A0A934T3V0_9BURK|nr:IS5 family transposase [Noviherbaspirillum pedocola]
MTPLAVLAQRLPWTQIEAALAPAFAHRPRPGKVLADCDLFGTSLELAGAAPSPAGRPRLPIRLMVALLYLKHAFNLSDEAVVERWSQDVVWQYFSGQDYYTPTLPCDPTQLGRFRKAIGEAGVEEVLKATIDTAVAIKAVRPTEFERVIVDTTVQEKAIAHPTDSRLLDVARVQLVRLAKRVGIALKQTYAREGKTLRRKAGGYAHARQFKRLRRTLRRQRTILGIVMRDIRRKLNGATAVSATLMPQLQTMLARAERIRTQQRKDKDKLYALHAPEVECIGKVRHEVAHVIVYPAHKAGEETGRSVDRSLPIHASLVTMMCEAIGTTWSADSGPSSSVRRTLYLRALMRVGC